MSARLDKLRAERDEVIAAFDALDAVEDPTAEQEAQKETLVARAAEINAEVKKAVDQREAVTAGAELMAKIGSARALTPSATPLGYGVAGRARGFEQEAPKLTAGEFLSLYMRAQGDAHLRRAPDAEAAQMLARALADQKIADASGILPKEIVGPLLSLYDASRPVFVSFTSRPMPEGGKVFSRPQITQHVTVAKNNTEKSESASQKMVIGGTDVTKNVFRGALDISQESIDWLDPSMLQIAIEDFGRVYARVSEGEACDFLQATASATGAFVASSTGAIVKSFGDAVVDVYDTAKEMPDTVWLSLDQAIAIATKTNSVDTTTAMNLIRSTLSDVGINLKFVVGPQLDAGTIIMGCSRLIESYEKQQGLLQAVNVAQYGWDVGFAAYLTFFGLPAGFVSLEP